MLRAASSAGKKRKTRDAADLPSSSTDSGIAALTDADPRLADLYTRWPGREAECVRLYDLLKQVRSPQTLR